MATSLSESEVSPSVPVHEKFWNLPNTITVVRLAVVPVLLVFPLFDGPATYRVGRVNRIPHHRAEGAEPLHLDLTPSGRLRGAGLARRSETTTLFHLEGRCGAYHSGHSAQLAAHDLAALEAFAE